jgi:MFS family permease
LAAVGREAIRRLTSITVLLFGVALLEELSSGVPSGGAPDIERSLGLSHTATAAVLFVVPGLVQLVLDPIVFVLADRFGRALAVRCGMAAMAATSVVAAIAPGPITLACALSIWGVATGAAVSFTEVTLLDHTGPGARAPEHRARTMARWSLLSLIGDFVAPVLLGALALLGAGETWRWAFAVVGGMLAAWTIALALRAFPAPPETDDDDEPPLWQAVRDAVRDRVLIGWLFGMALCNLLDETLVVFASIHVRELGASAAWQSLTVGVFVAGGAVGLIVLERLLLRSSERRLILGAGIACAVAFVAWLAAPVAWLSTVLIFVVGATSAPLYPLTCAQAYARRPGRSGVVIVASHLFAPFALALPWLLGAIADRAGVSVALAVMIAEPIGLVALALATRATTGDRDSRDSRTGAAP